MSLGETIVAQAQELGAISERPGMLVRSYLTPQHREAGERIRDWMRQAGMRADFDALGNVVGRYEGNEPGAPAILSGSHMDTVVDAGKYDGIFGVLAPIACVAELHRRGERLRFPVEIVAFGDEEGVRFGTSMIGSKALAGRFDAATLAIRDASGTTVADALRAFGGDAQAIASLQRDPKSIRVFVEAHIEQGPVLLNEGLPVGVVTAIAGATRARIELEGEAGHAGTVPMSMRRDALAAASEMVLALEAHCRASGGRLVGTVGKLSVADGGAINVIPGRVGLTVDLRSQDDAARREAVAAIEAGFRRVAAARHVDLDWTILQEMAAAPCDEAERKGLARAIDAHGIPVRSLPSGAGHDAMQFAGRVPTAMLFVRCGNGGISHSPRETLDAADADIATRVLLRYLEDLR